MQLGAWTANVDPLGRLALYHISHIGLQYLQPRILLAAGTCIQPGPGWQINVAQATSLAVTYTLPGQWQIILILRFEGGGEQLVISSSLRNLGDLPVPVEAFEPLAGQFQDNADRNNLNSQQQQALRHVFSHGSSMAEMAWIAPLEHRTTSHAVAGLTTELGQHAFVAGFMRLDDAFYEIELEPVEGRTHLVARCLREGIALQPGASLTVADLTCFQGTSLIGLLRLYAQQVGHQMHARPRTHPQPIQTGWCSWYYYYGTETAADVEANVRALAQHRDQLRVVQIDDGWNLPTPGAKRNWGDWQPGAKFPHGMRAVADLIHANGLQAGLWLAPFSVDLNSELLKLHPDWMVLDDKAQPLVENNIIALDLSHPEVLNFIRDTFQRVFHEWDFDYVKIDFLVHGARRGRRHSPDVTSAQAFRRGLEVIREVAGPNKFILNCGSPFGPSIGIADGMRVGFDVSTRWAMLDPANAGWPLGNCALLPAAHQSLARQWMHNLWWQNDPDCLLTRDYGSQAERNALGRYGGGRFKDDPLGLPEEEAACWTRLVWLLGGMTIISENMAEFAGPRRELLFKALPPNPDPAQWVDYYATPNLWVLATTGPHPAIGIFNLGDRPLRPKLLASRLRLGATWQLREWLSGETLDGQGDYLETPPLPPHAGRIWVTA